VGAGGIFAPILLSRAIERWGWRSSFVLCGLLAVTIALVWFLYSTNRPEEHRGVNSAELNLLGSKWRGNGHHSFHLKGTPWGKLLSSRSVWGLILSYFCHG
jgi:sugar phosphate permease